MVDIDERDVMQNDFLSFFYSEAFLVQQLQRVRVSIQSNTVTMCALRCDRFRAKSESRRE